MVEGDQEYGAGRPLERRNARIASAWWVRIRNGDRGFAVQGKMNPTARSSGK
jgi:hypothetical protein